MQVVAVNLDVLQIFIQQQLFNRFTAQLRDFTLQATDARFTGIVTNDANNRAVINRQLAFFQRITFNLLRQQVTFSNVQLLVFGITGQTDHFHTVQKRRWNVHGVRRRHEHYVAEIVIHFQVVIAERHVLFWIKYFQQSRGRVTAHVRRHFVDFIKQEQRVFNAHFGHFLDQFTRHRADVSTTVTADFRFVTHAAQRHTNVFTSGRLSNGLTQRGFTHTRRPYQAQDWPFQLVHTALNREILKNTVFDALKAIMVGIEDFLRLTKVFFDLAARIPWHLHHPVDITANHGGFS